MDSSLKGRRQLLRLWKAQDGICTVCGQKITELTGWHNHHIVWRSMGGLDVEATRVLLHPTCHQRVHSQKVTVAKRVRKRAIERLEPCEGKLSRTVLRGGATVTPPCYPTKL